MMPVEDPGTSALGTPAPNDEAGPSRPGRGRPNATILRTLTFTQNVSAAVFSVFVPMHLASPVLAAFGGLDAANNTMLIAREYYLPLEPLVIYAPIGIHLLSSLTKRLYLTYYTRRPPPTTLHVTSGYLLIPMLLPHIVTHRIIPSLDHPAIRALSPSEFGYDFVGWNLGWIKSWGVYLALAGVGLVHWGIGGMKIVSWIKRSRGKGERVTNLDGDVDKQAEQRRAAVPKRRRIGLRGILIGTMGIITIGLARIWSDSKGTVSTTMARRYEAVYRQLPWGSLYP